MSGLRGRLRRLTEQAIEELYTIFLHVLSIGALAGATAICDGLRRKFSLGWEGFPLVAAEIGLGVGFAARTWLFLHVYWRRLRRSDTKRLPRK